MAQSNVIFQSYSGTLLSTNLLSGNRTTIALNGLGPQTQGSISDDSGTIYVGETFSLGGRDLVLLGSGTADFGILFLPLGRSYDVLFAADPVTGERFFIYPDGAPSPLTVVSMRLTLSETAYTFDGPPVCFCAGTRILTRTGEVAVEDLRPGDMVVTHIGEYLPILWVGSTHYPTGAGEDHRPVVIRPGALGLGLPRRPLKVSPQHRIVLGAVNGERLMGPAKALLGEEGVRQQTGAHPVTYYHILLPRHAVLIAEGVPAESLFLGQMSQQSLSASALAEVCAVLDCRREELEDMPQAEPRCLFLTRRDAMAFRAEMREIRAPVAV